MTTLDHPRIGSEVGPLARPELLALLQASLEALDGLKDAEPGSFYRSGLRARLRAALALEALPSQTVNVVVRGDWVRSLFRDHGCAVLDQVRERIYLDESAVQKAMLALGWRIE